jgi:hypothetical protein
LCTDNLPIYLLQRHTTCDTSTSISSDLKSVEENTVEDVLSDFPSDMVPAPQASLSDDGGVNTANMSPIQGMCVLCHSSGFNPNTNP